MGILLIVGASLLFGVIPSVSKYVMLGGVQPCCMTLYTQCGLVVYGALCAAVRREDFRVPGKDIIQMLFLGAVGMGMTSFLINTACTLAPAGLVTVLHFLYPTVVSVVMILLFGQKLTPFKILAVAASITGMILIANPGKGTVQPLGIIFALCSSLTYSFYIVSNDVGSINRWPQFVKLFYCAIGSAAVMFLITASKQALRLPADGKAAVLAVLSGMCSFAAFYLINLGIRKVGASVASFVNMLEPITSVVTSLIVFHDVITLPMAGGIVLVLSAVLFAALGDSKG